jgi:AraC-like DNA-binding protein
MYPQKLELDARHSYFTDDDCFTAAPWHLVHAYDHENYKFKMHAHAFYEMNIITAGEGRHYIEESALNVQVGDVFVLPPKVSHGYFAKDTLDICHVLLREDFLTRYRAELSALPGFALLFDIEPQIRLASGQGFQLRIAPQLLPEIRAAAAEIMAAEQEGEYALQCALTLGFIGRLGRLLQKRVSSEENPLQRGELLRVMAHVQENLDRHLSLAELAAVANVSAPTLNRYFREILHTSPMQYVLQCRLTRARELLTQHTQSKTEIAAACGFYDVAHMNKYL